jgi:HTH-type transcriptional regulator/antitoxin HigA
MQKIMNPNEPVPAYATHPGEILKDELDTRNISQTEFAKTIGVQKSQLNEIINGKRGLNADLALLLEESLKIEAEYWMNAQKVYELDLARIEQKSQYRRAAIAQWNMVQDFVPVSYYKKQGVLSGDPVLDVPKVKEVYEASTLEEIAEMQECYARFRKSDKLQTDAVNLTGWVKLVEYRAKSISVSKFENKNQTNLINELTAIIYKNKNLLVKVEECLKDFGIKFVVQEKASKTPVDGMCFWSHGHPAIGVTLRHKQIDRFAFTLFHELGHVYQHLINNNERGFLDIEDRTLDNNREKEEKEADTFAYENLIDQSEWSDFYNSHTYHTDPVIKRFSKKIKVHPYIIYGRICHDENNYARRTRIPKEIM